MISFIARCRRALNPPRKRSPRELFSSERPPLIQEEGKRMQPVCFITYRNGLETHASVIRFALV